MEIKRRKALFVWLIFVSLVLAWLVGAFRQEIELAPFMGEVLPQAERFERVQDWLYVGYRQVGDAENTVGFVAFGSGQGYAGPIGLAVGLTPQGTIARVAMSRETETVAFLRKIYSAGLFDSVIEKSCDDAFRIDRDIQAVTGATMSLQGVTEAMRRACHRVARQLNRPVEEVPVPRVSVGVPEAVLLLLYVVGYLAYRRKQGKHRWLQRIGLALGFVLVGVWLSRPISLIHINAFLLGYWPLWQTHLYWYLLVGGVLLPILLTGKSPYCSYVCPFGAVQQALGALGGKVVAVSPKVSVWLRWAQRFLVWVAVLCALATRNPVVFNYEVTGTFFSLTGALWQFVLLAVVLIVSLFLTRPWCNYLCPIRVITDYLRAVRCMFKRS